MDTILCVNDLGVKCSPFVQCYAKPDSAFGVYNGRLFPWKLGESATADYWMLRRQAVLFNVPETPIGIDGRDAERLLKKVLTREVNGLRVGRAAYGIACAHDGGMMMDGVIMRLAPDRFWYVQANGEFVPWLLAHSAGLNVTIGDPDSWVLQIQGPDSLAVLERACDHGAPESFRYFDVRECEMAGQRLRVSRTGWTGELGFELYTLDREVDGALLWDHLLQSGAAFGLVFSSLRSMQIRRIEAGILDYGTDMDRSMTPYQAGLGRFVDLSKSDFIGRQALARADQQTRLFGIKCSGGVAAFRGTINYNDRPAGHVRSSAWSPFLDCGIGYVYVDAPGNWPGRTVSVEATSGAVLEGEIVPLPFYDADKRIPRGLDKARP